MSRILTLIAVICLSSAAFAAAQTPVDIIGTPVLLNNQSGVGGELIASEAAVNLTEYSLLKNPILWARGDKTLTVQTGLNKYSFHIPKSAFNANGEFNVDKNISNQPARVSSRVFKSGEIKTISNKMVECELPFPNHHNEFLGRPAARFKLPKMIEVQVETTSWEQRSIYYIISSDADYTVLKEAPERKSRDKIIGSLAECFIN